MRWLHDEKEKIIFLLTMPLKFQNISPIVTLSATTRQARIFLEFRKFEETFSKLQRMNCLCRKNVSLYFGDRVLHFGNFLFARTISTSPVLMRLSAGRHKTTKFKTKGLTYEMAQLPEHVGIRKAWLTWHSENLEGFGIRHGRIVAEDEIIRRFVNGIMHGLFLDEIIIKRRGNIVIVAGLIHQRAEVRKIYWLIGFTEEMLSYILKQPVKLEVQSVANKEALVYKYV